MFTANQLCFLLSQQPSACAQISGSISNPNLSGIARFYQTSRGILLVVEVKGLPINTEPCRSPMFGFHIHEGSTCTGTNVDPFADAGMHYNPNHCADQEEVGQLPSLFENQGEAFMVVVVSNFSLEEIIGRTLIIHARSGDSATQPSYNKIACGQIVSTGCTTI